MAFLPKRWHPERCTTLSMAHQLIDFEAACNEVYEKFLTSGISKADQSPFVILREVFADGTRCSLPVTEELVKTYIEKDFEVSI